MGDAYIQKGALAICGAVGLRLGMYCRRYSTLPDSESEPHDSTPADADMALPLTTGAATSYTTYM